jgi:hypothetical protein
MKAFTHVFLSATILQNILSLVLRVNFYSDDLSSKSVSWDPVLDLDPSPRDRDSSFESPAKTFRSFMSFTTTVSRRTTYCMCFFIAGVGVKDLGAGCLWAYVVS